MSDDDVEKKLAQLAELERRLKELEARPPINVSGDYVGGDKHSVCDISGGATAIGRGASATSGGSTPQGQGAAQQPMGDPALPYETRLRQQMIRVFSLSELRLLSYDLGINPDEIGAPTLEHYAQELIGYCKRRGMLEQLVALCRTQRPQLRWE